MPGTLLSYRFNQTQPLYSTLIDDRLWDVIGTLDDDQPCIVISVIPKKTRANDISYMLTSQQIGWLCVNKKRVIDSEGVIYED